MSTPTLSPTVPLREGQWQIADVVFGKGTKYPIATFPDISYGDVTAQDKKRARGDGIHFGRDSYGANLITFEMAVWSNTLEDDLQRLAKWWRGNQARRQPGKTMVLKYCYEGRQRQVFGRPRNFAPIPGPTTRDWIDVVCDFQCIDDKFYSQEEFHHRIGIRPPSIGGFIAPLIAPLIMSGTTSSTVGEFSSGGNTEAWLRAEIGGPVFGPEIELLDDDGWHQRMPRLELAHDQTAVVSSAPWDRKALNGRGGTVDGGFDQGSRKLSEWWLPPGEHEVVFRGNDATGTSYVDLFWREAFLNI